MAEKVATVTETTVVELKKSVTFFGFVALGLGGIFGSGWLFLASTWFSKGGGVINALIAWILIVIIEVPFILAYLKAVPMFPKAEGELAYCSAAFGERVGFWAGWFGIMAGLTTCAYLVCVVARVTGYTFPSVVDSCWYQILGCPVSKVGIFLGIFLILFVGGLHYRGIDFSSALQKLTTTSMILLVAIGMFVAYTQGSVANFKPAFEKPVWKGVLAVLVMLPYSLAGWETIAKGAEEAKDSSRVSTAILFAVMLGWLAYIISLLGTGIAMPWQEAIKIDIPFVTAMDQLTGNNVLGGLILFSAIIGVVGVYNCFFYAATRQMFGMSRRGLLPKWLSHLHPKYNSPSSVIIFVSCIMLIVPFLGKNFLVPVVDAAAVAFIVLWGSTFLSVNTLRKRYLGTSQEFKFPGGLPMVIFGYVSLLFMVVAMLSSLKWPTEFLVLGVLIIIGGSLYLARHKEG